MSKKHSDRIKELSRLTKEEWREYTKTVWHIANVSDPEHPAVFPEEIPLRLIKLFSFVGERVLDPFAGTGTTASVALSLGRAAICVDQKKKYLNIAETKCKAELNGTPLDEVLQLHHGDSRNLSFIESDSVDLVVTSPPYWDKADYGVSNKNIGKIKNYKEFLNESIAVFRECYRVLKPGRKLCIVTANVNLNTDHGLLSFPIASDLIVSLRREGFTLIGEIIWSKDGTGGKWGSHGSQRPIFGSYPYPPNFLFKNVHEYIIILNKPNTGKKKGNGSVSYDSVMCDSSS